jgi:hypothetical protein
MNKENVKSCLVRDKAFLRELYESNNSQTIKKLLISASDLKLNTVIKFLHFLSNGEIKIKKQNFDALVTFKRFRFLKKVIYNTSFSIKL